MEEKTLVLHIPVIHRGYLDFLNSRKNDVAQIYLMSQDLLAELTPYEPDIASLTFQEAKLFLESFGFSSIKILSKENIQELKWKKLVFVNDEVSRNLHEKYFAGQNVEWVSVFLRWDSASVVAEIPFNNIATSQDSFDVDMLNEAKKEAQKSGDWWRQVGAVLVKGRGILLRAYNQGVPTDHTPYQTGNVRDLFKAGEKQELANTIHAEPLLIAKAAKDGVALKGTSLYITHFPCAVCAKIVSYSGIEKLYFCDGASTLDGKKVLESAGIDIARILL